MIVSDALRMASLGNLFTHSAPDRHPLIEEMIRICFRGGQPQHPQESPTGVLVGEIARSKLTITREPKRKSSISRCAAVGVADEAEAVRPGADLP